MTPSREIVILIVALPDGRDASVVYTTPGV
jgi:hypothetical protein